MQLWPHSLPKELTAEAVSLMAIEVLDTLIAGLIAASKQTVNHRFLDWVADELTPLLEAAVASALRTQQFMQSLRLGDPRVALLAWVKHWACPHIRKHFDMYAVYCPCVLDAPSLLTRV